MTRTSPSSELHSPRSPIFSFSLATSLPVFDLHSISDRRFRIFSVFSVRFLSLETKSLQQLRSARPTTQAEIRLAPVVTNGKQPDKTFKQQTIDSLTE